MNTSNYIIFEFYYEDPSTVFCFMPFQQTTRGWHEGSTSIETSRHWGENWWNVLQKAFWEAHDHQTPYQSWCLHSFKATQWSNFDKSCRLGKARTNFHADPTGFGNAKVESAVSKTMHKDKGKDIWTEHFNLSNLVVKKISSMQLNQLWIYIFPCLSHGFCPWTNPTSRTSLKRTRSTGACVGFSPSQLIQEFVHQPYALNVRRLFLEAKMEVVPTQPLQVAMDQKEATAGSMA